MKLLIRLLPLFILGTSACSLPALPTLPKLPRILPTLPKLPALPQVSEVLPVASSGDSLQQAAERALPAAAAWDAGAELLSVQGTRLDPGGRNGGHKEGAWVLTFRAVEQERWLELRVAREQVSQREVPVTPFEVAPIQGALGEMLDSTAAIERSGLSGRSFTIVLRQEPNGPRYNILEEGGSARAVLDARTGAALEL